MPDSTSIYGQVGTYNRTVGVPVDMDDAIRILPVDDVPLQRWLPTDSTRQTKVSWLEEDLMAQTVTLTAVPTGTGPWTITVDDGEVLRPGDVLWKAGAASTVQYLVDSINTGAETAVVSGFAGNTTAPANADVLEIVGQYRNEGADPEEARSTEREEKFNYTQWAQEKVEATRTARKRELYGQGDPYDHEVGKKFRELAIRYEKSLVHGQRSESGDKKKRFMGGLLYYITTNSVSGVKANADTLINDLLRKCYDLGGAPRTLMVSPSVKRAISENINADKRRTTRSETTGGFVIDHYMSDFGEIDIVMNRHFPKTKGIALQREFDSRVVFDGYRHELLAKTGDADKGHIVGEFTLRAKNEKAQGVLTLTDA